MSYRSRERVAAILAHQEADRVPFAAFPEPEVLSLLKAMPLSDDQRQCYAEGDFRFITFRSMPDHGRLAAYLPELPKAEQVNDFGVAKIALKSVDGFHAGYRTFHPLAQVQTVEELESFPFPDMSDPKRHNQLEEEVRTAKGQQYTVIGQMSQTILETAYEMRGLDRLMLDFYDRPGYVRRLFEKLAEQRCIQARRFAEAGVDILRIGDDIATQAGLLISPQMYREWVKPHHRAVIAAARRVNPSLHVLYHSDGALTALLPELIEVGVTAINPVQPECMNLAETKRHFGDRLTLWGCSSVQSVYAHGRSGDVRNEIRARMAALAPGGGFVYQFTNMILTTRVLENLRCFFQTFYELARYQRD